MEMEGCQYLWWDDLRFGGLCLIHTIVIAVLGAIEHISTAKIETLRFHGRFIEHFP